MDLVTRVLVKALAGLGSEEEILAVLGHPWANTQFSVPIAGRDVDMIDAVFEEDVEHTVRLGLRGTAERRRAKECDCTHMSGASKRSFLNHDTFLSCACEGHKFSYRQTTRDTRAGSRAASNHDRARTPHLDEFCQDADADLLGRLGMNVEANRRMHPIQPLSCNALRFEVLPDLGNPGLAAEHPQVAGWTIINLLQDGMVVRMAPSHQHDIVVLAKVEHLPHALKRHHDSSVGVWKAFLVDKGRIVIDDAHSETGQCCGTHQRRDNMPPTKHRQHGCGQYRFQQKSQRAAIRSAVILDDTRLPKQHLLSAMLY